MHVLLNKQNDSAFHFFLHFSKERKERKEIPGGLEAETSRGLALCKALQSGDNSQERGPHNPPGCPRVTECHREAGFSLPRGSL